MWNEMDISADTKKMLNQLRDRKKEVTRLKKLQNFYTLATFASLGATFFYFANVILPKTGNNALSILSRVLDTRFFILICIMAFAAGQLQYYSKKHKSKKDKFDKLRAETIERLYSPWVTTTLSSKRDAISQAMQSQHGINITYNS